MKSIKITVIQRWLSVGAIWLMFSAACFSQKEVMMQAFYWNVPYNTSNNTGTFYTTLQSQLTEIKNSGFAALWAPPPSKGNWGVSDVGYGIYDHYDLGAYNQKGSTSTRYGTKAQLLSFLAAAHATPNRLDVFADAVLNHNYGFLGDYTTVPGTYTANDEEANPAVKAYVQGEAHNGANVAYQNTDIRWVIPNAAAGDYYIQIKGYNLPWSGSIDQRGYNVNFNWTNASVETDPGQWETEPNNGGGTTDKAVVVSGQSIRGHADYQGDIDEFKVHLTATHDIVIKLTAMQMSGGKWQGTDQTLGYYPYAVWYNGTNLATTTLQARTATASHYPTHTGPGEANYQWSYQDFHPVNASDWLGGDDGTDNIIPNQRWFGNDFNTYDLTLRVLPRLSAWGNWLVNTIGYDGFRLDFVRGYQIDFISRWISALPKIGGTTQRYIVGEYWTDRTDRLKQWVTGCANDPGYPATVSVFDFPLRDNLQRMCNGNGSSYSMSWLNNAGMVRDLTNPISGVNVCTFVDNHDNAKNSNQWVSKDWKMAYAYILTHEGRPCVFYNHFFGITEVDVDAGSGQQLAIPASLKTDIQHLIFVRNTYLGGTLVVLTQSGNPYYDAGSSAQNIYVARRAGNGTKSGAIIAINNHDSNSQGVWVDVSPSGWASWPVGTVLVDAFNTSNTTTVQGPSGGTSNRVHITAPSRGYTVWVKQSEYVAFTTPLKSAEEEAVTPATLSDGQLSMKAYPNPARDLVNISVVMPKDQTLNLVVYNTNGQVVATLYNGQLAAGEKIFHLNTNILKAGLYICKAVSSNQVQVTKIIVEKK